MFEGILPQVIFKLVWRMSQAWSSACKWFWSSVKRSPLATEAATLQGVSTCRWEILPPAVVLRNKAAEMVHKKTIREVWTEDDLRAGALLLEGDKSPSSGLHKGLHKCVVVLLRNVAVQLLNIDIEHWYRFCADSFPNLCLPYVQTSLEPSQQPLVPSVCA